MEDVFLQPFFKDRQIAVVFSHKLAGYWIDIAMEEIGKVEYTFSNAPTGAGLETPPGCERTYRPDASVAQLNKLAEEVLENSDGEFLRVAQKDFRHYFETAYKKDMAWKNRKGGITYEEFLQIEKKRHFQVVRRK